MNRKALLTVAFLGLLTRPGVGQDAERVSLSCDAEEVISCFDLGLMYANGVYRTQDFATAASLFQRACDGADMRGCYSLAWMYGTGQGVIQDLTRSIALFQATCDGGEMLGCSTLGSMYANGEGVPQDDARAASLFEQACDQGEMLSCYNLGLMYSGGAGLTPDPARTASYFERACDGGEPQGCNELGAMYATGEGVTRDDTRARILWQQACDTEDIDGCYNLNLLEYLALDDRTLAIGGEALGTLSDVDPVRRDGSYMQTWALGLSAGQEVTVDVASSDFDAFLFLAGPGLDLDLIDDDSGGGCDARITFTAPEDGEYRAVVNTVGARETGAFVLRASDTPATAGLGLCRPEGADPNGPVVLSPWKFCRDYTEAAIVTFADANLETAIREWLGVGTQGGLTCGQASGLTELRASYGGIESLVGIQNLTNLTTLWLDNNLIRDVSHLSSLTGLSDLWLGTNSIIDVGALSGLPTLARLGLDTNRIADIGALGGVTSLTDLFLSHNSIGDIAPLSGLTYLRFLGLDQNFVTDISALAGLTDLTYLNLGFNPDLEDIRPLLENTGLGELDVVSLETTRVSCTDVAALEARGVILTSDCR